MSPQGKNWLGGSQYLLESTSDILALIENQHRQMNTITHSIYVSELKEIEKQIQLANLIHIFAAHSEAKMRTIYDILKDVNCAQRITFDAMEENAVAKILIEELEGLDYRRHWNNEIELKAKVLARIIDNHMDQEEEEFFTEVRKALTKSEIDLVGAQFKEIFLTCF